MIGLPGNGQAKNHPAINACIQNTRPGIHTGYIVSIIFLNSSGNLGSRPTADMELLFLIT
jgi:hypothetical protein